MSETGAIFFLCYVKLRLQEQFFTCDCNVIFKTVIGVAVARESLKHGYTSTRAMGKFAYKILLEEFLFFSATFQKVLHCQRETCYI